MTRAEHVRVLKLLRDAFAAFPNGRTNDADIAALTAAIAALSPVQDTRSKRVKQWFRCDHAEPRTLQEAVEERNFLLDSYVGLAIALGFTEYADESEILARAALSAPKAEAVDSDAFCDANCVWTDHHQDCPIGGLVNTEAEAVEGDEYSEFRCKGCGKRYCESDCDEAQPESGGQGEAVAWRWPGGHWQDGTPTQVERDELFRAGKEPEYAYARPPASGAVTEAAEYEFEIWQDDEMQAGGSTSTLAEAQTEAAHYLMMFGQDSPATAKFFQRTEITAALAQRGKP